MERKVIAAAGVDSWTGPARVRSRAAVLHLRRSDPVMARVIDAVGPCRFAPRTDGTHFQAVIRSIVYQQLSGKAAATIHGRLLALAPDPDPRALRSLADHELRAAGLSRQKIGYLRDLAEKADSGAVPFDRLDALPDHEVLDALASIKGVGRWTGQMFLMFRLARPDVLPTGDLGIQNAVRRAYRMRRKAKPGDVERVGKRWSPHATVACWYLWRSLELPEE
jgi:DNA-3-methyladenine glycosylase II